MWKLVHIEAQNIVSFRELDMDIDQGVATLIFGQNLDNENQKANGSGKSSLIEAISFGITGETLRKVKADEIINDNAEEASIILVFDNDYDNTRFEVVRRIFRKSPQYIECHKYDADDNEIETDKTVQASVLEYNKFILDEIGLTKDEIYANYILCRNKYTSFFDASDKEKKEIINRFSNGVLVDESIAKLQEDLEPAEEELRRKEQAVSRASGKIEAVNEQIAEAEQKKEEAARTREQNIQSLREKIANKREEIRNIKGKIQQANDRLDMIDDAGNEIEEMEKNGDSLDDCYQFIVETFERVKLPAITDYRNKMADVNNHLKSVQNELVEQQKSLKETEKQLASLQKKSKDAKANYDKVEAEFKKSNADAETTINDIGEWNDRLRADVEKLLDNIRIEKANADELEKRLAVVRNKLHGVITCPHCGHKFLLEKNCDIDELNKVGEELVGQIAKSYGTSDKLENERDEKNALIKTNIQSIDDIRDELRNKQQELYALNDEQLKAKNKVVECSARLYSIEGQMDVLKNLIESYNADISGMSTKMFDEAYDIIDDKMDVGEKFIKNSEEDIERCNSIIEQYQNSIIELENSHTGDIMGSLIKSKAQYEKDLEIAINDRDKSQAKRDELKLQEAHFVAFKTHLANQKIDAIAAVTNGVLEDIGSDIRIEMIGYKVLKSGKIRDKITINVLRDGIDCGNINKFSAGERTRINLASIIALQRLTNANCENGKGLDLAIYDEILDASDESGIASYCEMINKMRLTSLVVTQGLVSESYKYRIVVTKQNGISTISY